MGLSLSSVKIVKKLLKWLTTSLLAVITLVAAGVLYITVAIDPNQYRSDIEALAKQNGIELSIEGDLEWQFLPLGVRLNEVNFAQQDQSMAGTISQLSVAASWSALIAASSDSTQLPINSLSIKDARLFLSRPNQLPVQVSAINLQASDIALDGSPFAVSLSLQALGGLRLSLDTELGVTYSDHGITDFSAADFKLALGDLKLSGDIQSTEQMAYIRGHLEIQEFDLIEQLAVIKQLMPSLYIPTMANSQALRSISLNSNFSIEPTQTSEIQTQLTIDNQPVDINVLIDEQRYSLTTVIAADSFNISPYLAQISVDNSGAALFAPLAVPLALWHGQSQVELTLGKLELDNFSASNIYINLFGNRNVFRLASFTADAFEGQINAVAKLDMRSSVANFNLQSSVNKVSLSSMMAAISTDNASDIEGILSLEANIQGSGNHTQTMIKSLVGSGQFDVLSPIYRGINLEQTFCNAVAMFGGKKPSNQQWARGTQLTDLTGNYRFNQGRLIISDYQTSMGNIALSGHGSLNLLTQNYRINNQVLVDQPKTSSIGCSVNKRLQKHKIPFRCDGILGDSLSCKPDDSLLKLFIQNSTLESLGDRLTKGLRLDNENNPLKKLIDKGLKSRRQ